MVTCVVMMLVIMNVVSPHHLPPLCPHPCPLRSVTTKDNVLTLLTLRRCPVAVIPQSVVGLTVPASKNNPVVGLITLACAVTTPVHAMMALRSPPIHHVVKMRVAAGLAVHAGRWEDLHLMGTAAGKRQVTSAARLTVHAWERRKRKRKRAMLRGR